MADPREDHLRYLLERTLELPAAVRGSFVAAKCGNDPELRQRLAAALVERGDAQFAEMAKEGAGAKEGGEAGVKQGAGGKGGAGTTGGTAAARADGDAPAPAPGPEREGVREAEGPEERPQPVSEHPPGTHIGPYTIHQPLGEGGFGTVYLAEQRTPVHRQVALKVLKPGMDSRQVVARFEQERQVLALMDHPNIAKVFDAGTTDRGLPYFVMELCRGAPLITFCDQHRQTVPQRLRLFTQICHAVQHAHSKGILHRDLKPSNVLVTVQDNATPTVKVIDFGIAKALTTPLTDKTLFTQAEQIIGTLQYMSPEQAEGSLDIDTRTDVYSLGVLLYELLTGSTPFVDPTRQEPSQPELHRRILQLDPPRPSTRLSQSGTALAALAAQRRTEPARLASTLRGELDWIAMKAIERDRTRRYATASELAQDVERYLQGEPVLAAPPSTAYRLRKFVHRHRTGVAAALAVFAALLTGAVAFAWQAQEARQQRDLARLAQRRAEDTALVMEDVFAGIDPSAEAELGMPLQDQLRQRLRASVAQLQGQQGDPLTRARLQTAFGRTLLALSDHREAETLLRQALRTRSEVLGPTHPDTVQVAESLAAAVLQLGRAGEAVAMLEELQAQGALADADLLLGMSYRADGRLERAIAAFERERARLQARGGPDTSDGLLALHCLGACYREAGRGADAIPLLREVLRRRTALLGKDHVDTLTTANSLAVAFTEAGETASALALYQETRTGLLERLQPDHQAVLNVNSNIAALLGRMGRAAEGVPLLEEAHRRCLQRYGPDHPDALRMAVALGRLLFSAGRPADGLAVLQQARPRLLAGGDESALAMECLIGEGRCLAHVGRAGEAVALLQPVLERRRVRLGEDDALTLRLLAECAGWQRQTGAFAAAQAILAQVLERQLRLFGEQHIDVAATRFEQGVTWFQQKESQQAIAAFAAVLPVRERELGPDHRDTVQTGANLGSAFWQAGQLDRSVPVLQAALQSAERGLGAGDETTLSVAQDLAVNLRDARRDDELLAHLRAWLPALLRQGLSGLRMSFAGWLVQRCQRDQALGEAVPVLEAICEQQRAAGVDEQQRLGVENNLAAAYWSARQFDRSVPLLQDLVARSKALLGEDALETRLRAVNLAVNLRDSGRAGEALPILEDLVGRVVRGELPGPPDFGFWRRELGKTQAACGQRDRCLQTVADYVAAARAGGGRLDSDLVNGGMILLDAGLHAQAEPLLRECLELRVAQQPDAWNTSFARVLLGSALHGLHRDQEARPLLEQGGRELRAGAAAVPPGARARLLETADRLLAFFADVGDAAGAEPWREWREELVAQGVRR